MIPFSEIKQKKNAGKNIRLTSIRRLMKQTKFRDTLNHAADEINDNLQQANNKFREARENAIDLNKTHILSLEHAHAREKETTETIERTLRL